LRSSWSIMSFEEKKSVVVITGATGPVGSKFAERFAETLAPQSLLVLSSRSRPRLGELKDHLQEINPDLTIAIVEWDLSKPDVEIFRADLEQVTDTSITYAGTPVKLKSAKYETAILVHNAAVLGDMGHKVAHFGYHLHEVQESLNVNLLSLLALNSAFLDVFKGIHKKKIVNLTAPSATNANPSFGYTSISKSAKLIALNILAKEEPSVKVLHFDPVFVDTEALREIRDHSHDENIRNKFQGFYDQDILLTGEQVAEALVNILDEDEFESGAIVKATDALHKHY